ncbi:MAG: hypothetical protein AAGM22_01485 [Acidobacteriota bacterium]
MINRSAIVLRAKPPMIKWINKTGPDDSPPLSKRDVNRDRTVYLISEEAGETEEAFREWVKANFETLFEAELMGWITDPEFWPRSRTFAVFTKWFDVEMHSVVLDTTDDDFVQYAFEP